MAAVTASGLPRVPSCRLLPVLRQLGVQKVSNNFLLVLLVRYRRYQVIFGKGLLRQCKAHNCTHA